MKRKQYKVYEVPTYQEYLNSLTHTIKFKELTYNLYEFEFNDKQIDNFVDSIKSIFRKSVEYKIWTNLKPDIQCQVTGYTKQEYRNEIELHHHPFTLHEIVKQVLLDFVNETQIPLNSVPSFIIQTFVSELHLLDIVPYVPLLKSYHKMYHQTPWEIERDKIINSNLIEVWNKFFENQISRTDLIDICLKIKESLISEN